MFTVSVILSEHYHTSEDAIYKQTLTTLLTICSVCYLSTIAVPPLGVYLLAKYCINDKHTILTSNCTEQNKKIQCMGSDNIRHFLCFVIISITITVSSVAPFISTNSFTDAWTSLECIIRRLFPFGRGLVHDYHAANIWSLYVTLDKIFSSWIKKPATRGTMRALPDVSPLTSSICVFLVSDQRSYTF